MKFKETAVQQALEALPGFKNSSEEFIALDQLNYLTFFLLSAMNSLTFAKKYNVKPDILNDEQVSVTNSLFRDAIMNYAKCFASAEAKKLKLDFNAVVKDLSPENKIKYKEIHEEMLRIRNSYVAHNLENEFEHSTIAAKIENTTLYLKPTYTINTPVNSFDRYFEQCGIIQNFIIDKIHKTLTKIKSNTGLNIEFG
jgi:hypothetical protein